MLTRHCGLIKLMLKGWSYCLTQLGFSLKVAPLVMQSITDSLMSQNGAIKNTMSTYIDNIYVNEGLVTATRVKEHLSDYGVTCKDPERLKDGTKVLA